MKAKSIPTLCLLAGLTALAACDPKPANDAASGPGPSNTGPSSDRPPSSQVVDTDRRGSSTGEITAIDKEAGTVTIKHEAVAGLGWPAMTMTFKATPSTLLDGHAVGDKVRFDVRLTDGDADVTALTAQTFQQRVRIVH